MNNDTLLRAVALKENIDALQDLVGRIVAVDQSNQLVRAFVPLSGEVFDEVKSLVLTDYQAQLNAARAEFEAL